MHLPDFSTAWWLHEDINIKLPFNNLGEQSNLDVYSAKKLREILCPDLGQAKFSHPAHYIHTFASICDFAHEWD